MASTLTADPATTMPTATPATPVTRSPPDPPGGLLAHLVSSAVGAGLDNLFRQVAVVALTAAAYRAFPDDAQQADALASSYSAWALMLFSAPFILLAPLAGSLGDRLPKHLIFRAARLIDVPIAVLGIWGYAVASPGVMLAAISLLAIASTFFGPAKLAVMPELVAEGRLARGNAALAAVTVASILIGTCLAACTDHQRLAQALDALGLHAAARSPTAAVWSLAALAAVLCLVGIIGAFRVPALTAQAPGSPIAMPWMAVAQLRVLNQSTGVWAPALGLAGFWALGGAAYAGLSPLAHLVYGLEEAGTVGMFLALVCGIIIGSALAPRYRARAFPAGLPLFGALLAGAAFAAAGWHAAHDLTVAPDQRRLWPFAGCLVLTGTGAGMWEVALTILLQERAPAACRNLIMSGVSLLASLGTFLAAGCYWLLTNAATLSHGGLANLSSMQAFMVLGGVTVAGALACAITYRHQCAGWLISLLLKLAYRVRVEGAEQLPAHGGCLVVCNHLSYADGAILATSLPRPGRFLVYRHFVEMPVIGFFLRAAGVIPVAAEDSRRALLAAIDAAVEAAKAGEVVVIFPEGKLTRSGQTDVFRSGLERIASRAGVPIVPAYLQGLWGTIASRAKRRSLPRPLRRVELRIGAPLPPSASAAEARDQVMHLGFLSAQARAERDRRTLGRAFIAQARRHPLRVAVQDAQGQLSCATLLGLARALIPHLGLAPDERSVGVLLPPGRAGTIVNLSLALDGRTAVNLNHTTGSAQLARMCALAQVRTIITAGPYLRRLGELGLPGRVLQVEEPLKGLGRIEILCSTLVALLAPRRLIDRARSDQVAAVIFSSGSTGDPKGVELTHRQILANCACTADGLDVHGGRDVLLSPLPLFHSFGLIPGTWLGLVMGMPVAAQPDPADGKALGELAERSGATFLISTPTFVRGYLRRIEPAQFKTLRFAVVGAERCPADLRAAFKSRYGSDLLEGYGCTELAPVVGVNLTEVHCDGVVEVRAKDGSIGRALPGLHVFAVDPEGARILPPGQEGLLVVRSPSRMRGYLDRPDLTATAFIHGGYNTGDIGRVDEDGFVSITGRLARFAKIGGEMVPIDNLESALQQALSEATGGEGAIELAIAAVADESRGERLVVLHTGYQGDWAQLIVALERFPALWRPKVRDIHLVDAIPKLGTGKRDLSALKRLAAGR
jgi:acyl-[acyl-carrier-protein]-phospholipid O-acyltransferase/long-chain-fatty-acid--[acyl-carrier-protein] ligase